ncbi:MAG: hypothetical protein ACW98G_17020 [Candidatus Hodarchaeales archaeon]|jgi:hypothetical protein
MTTVPGKVYRKEKSIKTEPVCTKLPATTNNRQISKNLTPLLLIVMILWLVLLPPYGQDNSLLVVIPSDEPPEFSYLLQSRYSVDDFIQTADGGFAFTMNGKVDSSDLDPEFTFPETILLKTDDVGNIQWSRPIGGIISETSGRVSKMIQTTDKGYALVGYTQPYQYMPIGHGDAVLAKMDTEGRLLWNRTYGGLGGDWFEGVFQTADGGYMLAGTTNSFGAGDNDIWLVKTDDQGIIVWSNTYETSEGYNEVMIEFIKTNDDGVAVLGYRTGTDASENIPILLKASGTGGEEWVRIYEHTFQTSVASCLIQTSEGKIVIAGREAIDGSGNAYILITNNEGIVERKIDYHLLDHFTDIIQTSDGGFALTGQSTRIYDEEWRGGLLLMKTDQNGSIKWQQIFTSDNFDASGTALVQTTSGGFAIACCAYWGHYDIHNVIWMVLTDSEGAIEGNRVFSGAMCDEVCNDLIQTADGGYALAGYTNSKKIGTTDIVLVKTSDNGTEEWIKTYGTSTDEVADVLMQTSDGGFAIAGSSRFSYVGNGPSGDQQDPWLVKTDEHGIMEWNKTFEEYEGAFSHLFQTSDDGFVLTNDRRWGEHIIKTNAQGQVEWTYSCSEPLYNMILTEEEAIILVEARWKSADCDGCSQFESSNGIYNISLVKINKTGTIQWKRTYIVKDGDTALACALIETSDKGLALVVSGLAERPESAYPIHVLNYSTFLLKMDEFGLEAWNQTVGEVFWEENYLNFIQMTDGSFYLTGLTSPLSSEYPNYGEGSESFFQSIILDENGILEDFTNLSYIKEDIKVIIPTLEGGFAFGGTKHSFNEEKGFSFDIALKKTDENRTVQWSQIYGQAAGQIYSWTVDIQIVSFLDNRTTTDGTSANSTSFSIGIYGLPLTLILLRQRKKRKDH